MGEKADRYQGRRASGGQAGRRADASAGGQLTGEADRHAIIWKIGKGGGRVVVQAGGQFGGHAG